MIDYLAKDFESFCDTLITAMSARVPGWRVTSEADLDQVLIDLFAAAADELSDYQDRTIGEAYRDGPQARRSPATRGPVDYHVHQGHQASTWLVVLVADGVTGFGDRILKDAVWAGHPEAPAVLVFFSATRQRRADPAEAVSAPDPLVNELALHTWSDAQPALLAGSTSAEDYLDHAVGRQDGGGEGREPGALRRARPARARGRSVADPAAPPTATRASASSCA